MDATIAGLVGLLYLVFATFSAVIAWFFPVRNGTKWLGRFVWWHGAAFIVVVLGGGTVALILWLATQFGQILVG